MAELNPTGSYITITHGGFLRLTILLYLSRVFMLAMAGYRDQKYPNAIG